MSNNKLINIKNGDNHIQGDNNSIKDATSNRFKTNNKIDNSITKNITNNNNKIIPKNKNTNKKQKVNRNILPPQEEPTVENGGFVNILDQDFIHLRTKPEITNTSFIRPNLEKLYYENKSIEMFAYVTSHRNKDNRFVLYNLCSESMFLADHVVVDPDQDNIIYDKVGQCIRFTGTPYNYGDKYSITISNVKDLDPPKAPILQYNEKEIDIDDIKDVFILISEMQPIERYELLKYLLNKLEAYSVYLFSNKKFIISMICNFYFMGAINNELSSNKYLNQLDRSKERFIKIFSDILFRIENGLIQNFNDLQNRVISVSLLAQGLPEKNVFKKENKIFIDFCKFYNIIDIEYIQKYMKNLYKWYDIKDIIKDINQYKINNEMRYAVASIILSS